jgi:hypothetical protein
MTAPDPMLAVIEAHRHAYAAFDKAVDEEDSNASDCLAEESPPTFDALRTSSERLAAADFKTIAGLVALLEYMAPLLQEQGAPAMPLEVLVEDQQWETVFGMFCANLAKSVAAIATEPPVAPEYVDWVADDIIGATGDLFDDYDVVRKIARAAITSVAEYRTEARS